MTRKEKHESIVKAPETPEGVPAPPPRPSGQCRQRHGGRASRGVVRTRDQAGKPSRPRVRASNTGSQVVHLGTRGPREFRALRGRGASTGLFAGTPRGHGQGSFGPRVVPQGRPDRLPRQGGGYYTSGGSCAIGFDLYSCAYCVCIHAHGVFIHACMHVYVCAFITRTRV